jgi:hypothetical protein
MSEMLMVMAEVLLLQFSVLNQVSFLPSTTMAMRYVYCACLSHTTRTCNTLGRIHGKTAAAATLPMPHNDAEIKGRYRPAFSIFCLTSSVRCNAALGHGREQRSRQ